jgi:hypothetical protein
LSQGQNKRKRAFNEVAKGDESTTIKDEDDEETLYFSSKGKE